MALRKDRSDDIEKDAIKLFEKGGHTKQQVFDQLVEKYGYAQDVAGVLTFIPSPHALKRYGRWNTLLLGILILTASAHMWVDPGPGLLIGYLILIPMVAIKAIKQYARLTGLYFVAVGLYFFGVVEHAHGHFDSGFMWLLLIFLPSVVLPTVVKRKLCPDPKEHKEVYTNSEGQERLRVVYDFGE